MVNDREQADAREIVGKKGQMGLILAFFLLIGAAMALIFYRLLGRRDEGSELLPAGMEPAPPPAGLSEAEAMARQDPDSEQDNIISGHPAYSRQQIVRQTILSIFNLNLIILATIQFLFVRPLDGLITLGIIVVNVVVNVLQYEIAQRRIKEILIEARPQVTVMRDGKARSIDPRELVIGDVLTAGQGDQIIADGLVVGRGELVVDEMMLGSGAGIVRKQAGDQILAGSICLNGRAAYQADVLGDRRQVIQYLQSLPNEGVELTAIEKILSRIMRVLLVIMIAMVAFILLRIFSVGMVGALDVIIDPIIVILNLAPASLFFMVVLTYVSATADLAKIGALVYQSRSVESLAQLDVICFAKAGFLTGIGVEIVPIVQDQGEQGLSLARIGQILGDFAHSSTDPSQLARALAANLPGSKRQLKERAPFLSAYGWSAIVFDDDDLQGLYVVAEPEVIAQDLARVNGEGARAGEEEEQEDNSSIGRSLASAIRSPFDRLRRRGKKEDIEVEESEPQEEEEASEEPEEQKGRFSRWRSKLQATVSSLVKRGDDDTDAEPQENIEESKNELIFAYNEEIRSLHMENGEWQLPDDLRLLCRVSFEEQVKPEAVEAINTFNERDVAVKIFTPDDSQKTASRLREAGVSVLGDAQLRAINGSDLEDLTMAELSEIALSHTVFGLLTPQKSAGIVHALREAGLSVGAAGDGVSDVAALRGAEMAIVRKDSSPAVLAIGDIVLLEEGQMALSRVLDKGQRIVNGLIDILKLYLTQIFYLLLLIFAIWIWEKGFPYTSAQAGLISLITLTIPALALTLWASTGKLPRDRLGSILLNFVVPAVLAVAILGFLVYTRIYQQTGSIPYAQNVLTYALVAMGLLLVLSIKPPLQIRLRSWPKKGDIRPLIMVIFSAVVFLFIARIPFFSDIFGIVPLQSSADAALVISAALIWVITVQVFWLLFPAVRTVGSEAIEVIETV